MDLQILKDKRLQVYEVVKYVFDLQREVGGGMDEPIYQEMYKIIEDSALMPCEREKELDIWFRGNKLRKKYTPDFLCHGDIVVEFKTIDRLGPPQRVQLFNYLRVTKHQIGVLVNFRYDKAYVERWYYDRETNRCYPFQYDKDTKEPIVFTPISEECRKE